MLSNSIFILFNLKTTALIFEAYPELKTQRLVLRKPEIHDWPVVSFLRSDEELNRFVKRPKAETKEKAMEFIENTFLNMENDKLVSWFICLRDNPQMIGSICLWNISEDRKTAEVGYDLSPQFHGKGIMDEAIKAVLDYGFNKLSLDVIEAFTSKQNEPSKKLLIRNNFKFNAERKDHDNLDNIIFELRNS